MASSSSLPLSSTDHQNHYTYEVFLSFRGEDTGFNFTDHLYTALCQRGIKTFRDAELNRGEAISHELLNAIEESRVSIVVFSQNYASSRWCLDELVRILECRKSKGQVVIPIFYKVPYNDVRRQSGAFGDAFATLDQCNYKDSMDKWRVALKEAAFLPGWAFEEDRYEAFINDIVEELFTRVNLSRELHVAENPIGLKSCTQDVNTLLQLSEKNIVRMVGIWGPGGIGKTTIAKAVFNSIRHNFEGSCFLADVRSNSCHSYGILELQERLLVNILRRSSFEVSSVYVGVSLIKSIMCCKKVLIVLDDVSCSSQLECLVRSPDWFGPGSRILVTTRDKHLLIAHYVDQVYEVKMLNDRQALELFSLQAFKRNIPPSDYLELVQCVIRHAKGLPLSLVVLGSYLRGTSIEEWKSIIDGRKVEYPIEMRNVLRPSYDDLDPYLKKYFLDIACFFNGKLVDDVKKTLQACYYSSYPLFDIARLQEKALIRIEQDEAGDGCRIWMDDSIEKMGKDIVYQESPDEPGERSRVWSEDDVHHVLTNNTGTKKVIGIHVSWRSSTISLNAKSFSKMKNLRYISMCQSLKYESFSGHIDHLSNRLQWLDWPNSPLQSFPSDFYPKKLVMLNIPDSHGITRLWEGRKKFSCLTHMNLRGCESLTELPDFSGIPNLIELDLSKCTSLVKVPDSVGLLNKLVTLNVCGCSNLMCPKEPGQEFVETISIETKRFGYEPVLMLLQAVFICYLLINR